MKGQGVHAGDPRSHPGHQRLGQPGSGAGLRCSPAPAVAAHVTLG